MQNKKSMAIFTSALLVFLTGTMFMTSNTTSASNTMSQNASDTDSSNRYTIALGLQGYSPVSYLDNNRAEPGSPRHASTHNGTTYFFTSAEQQAKFERTPERYLPAYGGYCAFGCAVDAKFIADPEVFKIVNGQTFLFLRNADVDALQLWNDGNEYELTAKANRYWATQDNSRAYVGAQNVPANGIGLSGFSPVSYFTTGQAEKGKAEFAVEHDSVTYHLTSAAQVEMFKKNQTRYQPQCGGWCAFGMSIEDKFPVDPTKFAVINDRLYVFLKNDSINARDLWMQGDEHELLKKAHGHWKTVSGQ